MDRNIYKTSEAIYHNTRNEKMKLFSFGFVSPKQKISLFTKRVRSVFTGSVGIKGVKRGRV
jgi:hypothetical protein